MKNPFRRRKAALPPDQRIPEPPNPEAPTEPAPSPEAPTAVEKPDDGFTEWCRSQVRGGIERRERNDIFEAYSVYGADRDGRLTYRYYHRYPEHERGFDLSCERALSFDEFNRRLLSELDKGDVKLSAYQDCIKKAEQLAGTPADERIRYDGFTDEETAVLQDFCDAIDILQNKQYLHNGGVLSCECESVVGEERLNIRFRKPISHDALHTQIAGVRKESVYGYDIGDLWIMGVYNRLRDRCAACKVFLLTSEWSIEKESLYLIEANDFAGIGGDLLIAVGAADSFRRFGFYSLDFSKK